MYIFFGQNSFFTAGIGAFGTTKFRIYNWDHTSTGFDLTLNYAHNFDKNKFIGSLILGPRIVAVSDAGTASYIEIAALYVREFALGNYLALEPAAGIGYFSVNDRSKIYSPEDYYTYTEIGKKSGLALPLRLSLVMDRSRKFSYGFAGQYSVSKPISVYNVSTFARLNF